MSKLGSRHPKLERPLIRQPNTAHRFKDLRPGSTGVYFWLQKKKPDTAREHSVSVHVGLMKPFSPDTKGRILITDLHWFLMEEVRRICLNIKTSYYARLFLSLECSNKKWSCGEKFHFHQALGLKGFSALSSISSHVLRGSLNDSFVPLKKENRHHFAAVSFLSVPCCSENV